MAVMLARSSIVPETFRGREHLGNCLLALEIANRIGTTVLAVMQNLCLVQGRLGWSSQFLIACVNATNRFSPVRYEMTGVRSEDSWGCIAWAIDRNGDRLNSPEVTIKMAKEEGWYYGNGSKWKTMPELMLCYRSATLFARLYAPEITMGIQTSEEVADTSLQRRDSPTRPIFEIERGKPRSRGKGKAEGMTPTAYSQQIGGQQHRLFAAVHDGQESPTNTSPGLAPEIGEGQKRVLKALIGLIGLSQHSETDVLRFLRNTQRCQESCVNLAELAEKQAGAIVWAHDNWRALEAELTRLKQAAL